MLCRNAQCRDLPNSHRYVPAHDLDSGRRKRLVETSLSQFGIGTPTRLQKQCNVLRHAVPITPDLTKNQTVSVSKAKKAIADYDKNDWAPGGFGGAVDILL